jgi:hypothetical protein
VFDAMFKGVAPGTYELTFLAPTGLDATFDPTLPRTITVVAKEIATDTVTVTAVALASAAATEQLDTHATRAFVLASASAFLTSGITCDDAEAFLHETPPRRMFST